MQNLQQIASPKEEEPQNPPVEIITRALSEPLGSSDLDEMVGDNVKVVIALEGRTSPHLASAALATILKELGNGNVLKDNITILIGNGPRLRTNKKLIETINSNQIIGDIRIEEQRFNYQNLVDLGKTQYGTPISVNKTYYEADLKIAIGETRIDNYTGFTGAHTAVLPGICSRETVESNRGLIFKSNISPGVIEPNPIKEDTFEAVKTAGLNLALNLVSNNKGGLIDAYAGGLEESWDKAIASHRESYELEVEGRADIAVVSAGGSRYDFDLYHAAWALETARSVVKKGGSIIFLAECSDGLGVKGMERLAHIDQLSELERRYELGGEVVQIIRSVSSQNRVILVSSLPKYSAQSLGLEIIRSTNEAYDRAIRNRRGKKTIVIPYGCSTILFVAKDY